MRNVKRTIALFFIIIGLTGLMAGAVSLINPISPNIPPTGSEAGNDLSLTSNLLLAMTYLILLAVGVIIVVQDRQPSRD